MKRILTLGFLALCAMALTGCFEVENGPAFAGGDEVPGLEGVFSIAYGTSPDEGRSEIEDDEGPYTFQRATNGAYVVTSADEDDDLTLFKPVRVRNNLFIYEISEDIDENMLGVLSIDGDEYRFCMILEMEPDEQFARAAEYGIERIETRFGLDRYLAPSGDAFVQFLTALWDDTSYDQWACTVMVEGPPEDGGEEDAPAPTKTP